MRVRVCVCEGGRAEIGDKKETEREKGEWNLYRKAKEGHTNI